jgi:hypothetical protein
MSVDDMLWWLYDTYKIVVGTRTIRRVFERKGDKGLTKVKGKSFRRRSTNGGAEEGEDDTIMASEGLHDGLSQGQPLQNADAQYQSPFAPMASELPAEQQLVQAFQQQTAQHTYPPPPTTDLDGDLPDDEETLQLQLEQIALQKREVELKLKMRRLQSSRGISTTQPAVASDPSPSILYNPNAVIPTGPKRDSRSKKKIEESKRRTAERQERMLRELERRSRRRDHLTAEWVTSKDIWPLRAQGLLADLMHRYACYTFGQNSQESFEVMYQELYQLVDLTKGDWVPGLHDEMLRERMKRKMGQLRAKMQKTGEIVPRNDGYGGFQKSEDYTGEQAGAMVGGADESELVSELTGSLAAGDEDASAAAVVAAAAAAVQQQQQQQQAQQAQQQAQQSQQQQQQSQQPQQIHYEPVVPDHHLQTSLPYAISPQYPMMDQNLLRAQGPFFTESHM